MKREPGSLPNHYTEVSGKDSASCTKMRPKVGLHAVLFQGKET